MCTYTCVRVRDKITQRYFMIFFLYYEYIKKYEVYMVYIYEYIRKRKLNLIF